MVLRRAWLVAIVGTAIGTVIALAAIPVFWVTNDDYYIQLILSGEISGSASPYVMFVNWGLCWVVSKLFVLAPGYPWWALVQFVAACLAIMFIARTAVVLGRARWRALPMPFEILSVAMISFVLSSCFIARMQFTTTSALLMSAAVFGTCCWRQEEGVLRGGTFTKFVVPVFLAVFGFAYRRQSGYMGYLFWVATLLTILLPHCKRVNRGDGVSISVVKSVCGHIDWILPIVLAGSISLCLIGLHLLAYSSPEWREAVRFSKMLSQYTDYPHQSYEQDPGRYEMQGWDQDLAWLVGNWYLMDERVNADVLEKINDGNSLAISNLLSDPLGTVRVRMGGIVKPTPASYMVLEVAVGALALFGARTRCRRLGIWSVFLMSAGLFGYLLVFKGRLPERALYSILLPAIGSLFALLLEDANLKDECDNNSHTTSALAVYVLISIIILLPFAIGGGFAVLVMCLLGVVLMACMIAMEFSHAGKIGFKSVIAVCSITLLVMPGFAAARQYGWPSSNYQQEKEHEYKVKMIADYLDAHSDTFYIVNPSGGLVSLRPWNMEIKRNADSWGGWRFCYPWYQEGMKKSSLGHVPTNADLFQTDVYYVSASDDMDRHLLGCLERRFDGVNLEYVDNISDDVFVYQFVQEN